MSNCNSIPLPNNGQFKDLSGRVFSRLTVLSYAGSARGHASWLTHCVCGAEKVMRGASLVSGNIKSCGCLAAENAELKRTHGMRRKPEYKVWAQMWQRCTNPNAEKYSAYKDRAPPSEWKDFAVFFAELGPRPTPKHTLERIDNEKPYGPGNCRWATMLEQCRNKSNNRWVIVDGSQVVTLTDACRIIGVTYGVVKCRRGRGESLEQATKGRVKAIEADLPRVAAPT